MNSLSPTPPAPTDVTTIVARLAELEARVRALYQQRYPLIGGGAGVPRKILEALQKIRWYEFVPEDIYLIDNSLGFGHREHLPVK